MPELTQIWAQFMNGADAIGLMVLLMIQIVWLAGLCLAGVSFLCSIGDPYQPPIPIGHKILIHFWFWLSILYWIYRLGGILS